jgi:hypothetical protein
MLSAGLNTVYATTAGSYPASSMATVQTPSAYLQPGTLGSSTVSNGDYATVTITSSALPIRYVPVNLTNSQGTSTPNPLQVLIQPNPSLYSLYEASDLGNIRFCSDTGCTAELYSWLEGCGSSAPYGSCSTASTSATFWIRLTSSIAGSGGTLTIYMAFLSTSTDFDGIQAGEAPTLSGTYGQFDNGVNVFTVYDNFAGTSLSPTWVAQASAGGAYSVSNGINLTVSSGSDYTWIHTPNAEPYPLTIESDILSQSGGAYVTLGVSLATTINSIYGEPYDGYDYDFYPGYGGGVVEIDDNTVSNSLSSQYTLTAFHAGIWSFSWYATGAETGTDGTHPLADTSSSHTIGNYYLYLGIGTYAKSSFVAQWFRARVTPPNNVMTSASFGAVRSWGGGAVLKLPNSGSSSWLVNLAAVTFSNAGRLNNLTISFTNPYSQQVILGTGVTNQNSGPQVTLAASSTITIVLGVTVNSAGTTIVTLALKIQSPPSAGATSVYCYDIISLTVN